MRHITLIILGSLLLLLTGGCDGEYMPEEEPQLVVEGWIDQGGYPVVLVSLSMNISEEPTPFSDIQDYILRWAKVSISNGTDTCMMMGRSHPGYFPPFIYTTYDMTGEAGKTYTITVTYRGHTATASTTIPEAVKPDSIVMRPVVTSRADNDTTPTIYEGRIFFTPPAGQQPHYYTTMARVGESNRHFRPTLWGTYADNATALPAELPVYQPHSFMKKRYSKYFLYGDTLAVKFATIDAESYKAIKDFSDILALPSTVFLPATNNIHTNIQGGLGYWIGCNASFEYFIVGHDRHGQ